MRFDLIAVKLLPRAHDPNKMYKAKIGIESLAISRQDTDASSIESLVSQTHFFST